jgi:hypothetical protein
MGIATNDALNTDRLEHLRLFRSRSPSLQ